MVMRATTITMEPVQAEGWAETAGVLAVLGEEDTGAGEGQLIAGLSGAAGGAIGGPYGNLLAGAGQIAGALVDGKAQRGGALGTSIGQLAGGAIGTVLGGSTGAALGGAAGQIAGNLIGGAVEGAAKKRGPNRTQARQRARAKVAARVNQARAETPPAAPPPPKAKPIDPPSTAPTSPTSPPKTKPAEPAPVSAKRDTPPAPQQPEAPRAPQFPPLLLGFRNKLTDDQRARLDQAIHEKRGAAAVQEILAERSSVEAMEAELARQNAAPTFVQPSPPIAAPPLVLVPTITPPATPAGAEPTVEEESPEYDDAAAPPARRPRPRLHVGLIPLQRWQLEALLVKVPALRKLDTRLLRAMTGNGSTVRDTAGIDTATRTYRAEPGETALGIAKKLTGKGERAADLLAANPGHRDEDPVWRIPPGWMYFTTTGDETESDTGATSRLYIVQKNDTPVGIATRSGAKAARPRWWNELKAANPQIPTTDNGNNFERFFAGDQLWIPDDWPQSPMFPQAGTGPVPTPNPSPQPTPQPNTTMDPGVFVQAQALLALWALMNPGVSNPPDYGSTPSDITGTTTTRFTSALASFQNWYNAKNAGAKLRTDGILDPPTYQALHATTAGTMTPPGPGGVPWSQPAPQGQQAPQQGQQAPQGGVPGMPGLPWGQPAPQGQQAPQQGQQAPQGGVPGMPGLPGLPWGQPTPQGGGNGPQGVPGINGGIPQLGGWGAPLGPNSIPILIQTIFRDGPPPSVPGPALPSNAIGAQVPGWPPGSTIAADQTIQYNGQPVPVGQQVPGMAPGVLWSAGGLMTYQGQPYIPYNPIPNVPGFVWSPYIPNYRTPWMPESWTASVKASAAQGFPQVPQQQGQPQQGQPQQGQPQQGEPKKDSGAVLPLLLAAATIAFS